MKIEVGVLGRIEAWHNGEVMPLGHARQRAVLAALVVESVSAVPADQLIRRLWGDDPSRNVQGTLYSYVSRLRKVLLPAGVAIERTPSGYLITEGAVSVDVQVSRDLVDRARKNTDSDEASALFQEAFSLWRGSPFTDLASTWFDDQRSALENWRRAAELDFHDVELRRGRHDALMPRLLDCVAARPTDERAAGQFMLALYRCGQPADALRHYERIRRTLADELGTDPGRQLQRLHQEILTLDSSLDLQAAPRTNSAPRSDRARSGPTPRQLPHHGTGLVGRTEELNALDAAAGGSEPTVTLITGMAGVGKTALAIHWARGAAARFPDGQLFVDLCGHGPGQPLDPTKSLTHLLNGLGFPASDIPSDLQQAAALFRSAVTGRRLLLILDNASSLEQVRPLIPGALGTNVLVTSRERLTGLVAIDGAREIPLRTLGVDEAAAMISNVVGPSRIHGRREAVEDLAHQCGFLPLAIRIAAAQVAASPEADIGAVVERMTSHAKLSELSIRGDAHSAVRYAFQYSYTALDAASRALFRLLGTLPFTTFPAALAAALLNAPHHEAEALLFQLADAHLVEQRSTERFALHDLIHLFAEEQTRTEDTADERAAALRRVYTWYARQADRAARAMFPQLVRLRASPEPTGEPFASAASAGEWLSSELPNLVTAIMTAQEHSVPEVSWLLVDALRGHYLARRTTAEWSDTATAGLAAAEAADDLRAQAMCRLSLALARHSRGDYQSSTRELRSAHDLAERAGWPQCQASTLTAMGVASSIQGRSEEAADSWEQALRIDRALGNEASIAVTLNNLGALYTLTGQLDLSLTCLRQALDLHRTAGRDRGQAAALINLGRAYHQSRDLRTARQCLTQARDLDSALGYIDGECAALARLAEVDAEAGQHEEASRHAQHALALVRPMGDPYAESAVLNALATARHAAGQRNVALLHFRRSYNLAEQVRSRETAVSALIGTARIFIEQGQFRLAEQNAARATTLAHESGYRPLLDQALDLLRRAGGENRPSHGANGTKPRLGRGTASSRY